MPYILAIDQGTSSSRALLFDQSLRLVGSAQQDLGQDFWFACKGRAGTFFNCG